MSARKRSPLPEYEPQLALLVDDAPEGDDWLHELKFDGYRIGVRIDHGKVALLSRRAKDWTEAFPTVVAGARKIDATTALIDGELAGVLPDGRTSLHAMGGSNLAFFAFDLLHVDGEDLFGLPLDQRKLRLAALLGDAPPAPFRYVEHHVGDGAALLQGGVRDAPGRHRVEGARGALQGGRAQRDLAQGQVRAAAGVRDRRLRTLGGRRTGLAVARHLRRRRAAGIRRQGGHRLSARSAAR